MTILLRIQDHEIDPLVSGLPLRQVETMPSYCLLTTSASPVYK